MNTKLAEVFSRCKAENRAALIGYYPVGFPDVEQSLAAVRTLIESGCDIVEIGVPYSDPLMDGPLIEAAVTAALAGGVRVADTFAAVQAVTDAGGVPVVMSYWNLLEQYGLERFCTELVAAGGAGVVTADLIPEEAGPWCQTSDAHDVGRIFLVAPSSSEERLHKVAEAVTGFVYAAAVMGVTGMRSEVSEHAEALARRVRAVTDKPVCVGLGVSSAAQVREIAAYADGVIVGSALVAAMNRGGLLAVAELTRELATGLPR